MTGKWFSYDEDFSQLIRRTKTLSEQSKYMTPKHKQVRVQFVPLICSNVTTLRPLESAIIVFHCLFFRLS